MGNANGGGSGSFRREHVESASYHTRPLQSGSSSSGPGDHHGVVVKTKEGNEWLIHNPGPHGITVVTSASNMGPTTWTKDHDIAVAGDKTVQEIFNAASGRTTNPLEHYVTAGTCLGSARAAEKALKK